MVLLMPFDGVLYFSIHSLQVIHIFKIPIPLTKDCLQSRTITICSRRCCPLTAKYNCCTKEVKIASLACFLSMEANDYFDIDYACLKNFSHLQCNLANKVTWIFIQQFWHLVFHRGNIIIYCMVSQWCRHFEYKYFEYMVLIDNEYSKI